MPTEQWRKRTGQNCPMKLMELQMNINHLTAGAGSRRNLLSDSQGDLLTNGNYIEPVCQWVGKDEVTVGQDRRQTNAGAQKAVVGFHHTMLTSQALGTLQQLQGCCSPQDCCQL